ncbi:MAG: HEAT repeat domain-containing protein [Myxococcota bacterium]
MSIESTKKATKKEATMKLRSLILPALVLTLAGGSLAQAQEVFEVHNRERGELSPGAQAPTRAEMMRVIETGSPGSLIATLEYGERVECHACVAPLQRNLLESSDSEVRRISAWWLRHRPFAIAPIMNQMRTALANDADPVRRARAAQAIGEFLDPAGLAPLREAAMGDAESVVREAAVRGLGRLNHPGGNEVLAAALADGSVEVRRAAIDVVLTVNFFRDGDAIIGALADDDATNRMRAARIAGDLGVAGAVPVLIGLLQGDDDVLVRQAAAFGLGRIGGTDARGALRAAQTSESESQVLDAIEVALRMINR